MIFYELKCVNKNYVEPEDDTEKSEITGKHKRYKPEHIYSEKEKLCIFISEIIDDKVEIGIIQTEIKDITSEINNFLKENKIDTDNYVLSEITVKNLDFMVERAVINKFIRHCEQVYNEFRKNDFFYLISRKENLKDDIVPIYSKDEICENISLYFSKDQINDEIGRIFAGQKVKEITYAHPVHYIISNNSIEVGTEIAENIISALYQNNRLKSRRISYYHMETREWYNKLYIDDFYRFGEGGAVIISIDADDSLKSNNLAYFFEEIEKVAEVAEKNKNKILTVFIVPTYAEKIKEDIIDEFKHFTFVEIEDKFASYTKSRNYLKALAEKNGDKPDRKLFSLIEKDKNYFGYELDRIFDMWFDNRLKTEVYPQYKKYTLSCNKVKKDEKCVAYDKLSAMVGLNEAKSIINKAVKYYKAQKIFAEKGMKRERLAMHMVFTGNPGTAKTTVARLFAEIMRDNGLLSKGQLIEVGRADLVGKFVGWTAPTIKKYFQKAMGGVLFIDEAYSLVDGNEGMFGDEAINTIVQEMENYRKDLVVIFAGYPDKMEEFINKNPGLRSRIAFNVPFEDYSVDELCDIAKNITDDKELKITDDAIDKMAEIFENEIGKKDFGNGRFVRNIIEKAQMNHSDRLLDMDLDKVTCEDIMTITAEDVNYTAPEKEKIIKKIGF